MRGGKCCVNTIGIVGDAELPLDLAREEAWGR